MHQEQISFPLAAAISELYDLTDEVRRHPIEMRHIPTLTAEEEDELRRPAHPFYFHALLALGFALATVSNFHLELSPARQLGLPLAQGVHVFPVLMAVLYLSAAMLVRKLWRVNFLVQCLCGFAAMFLIPLFLGPLRNQQIMEIPLHSLPGCEAIRQPPREVLVTFEQRFSTKITYSHADTSTLLVRRDRYTPAMRDFLAAEIVARHHSQRKESTSP